MQTNPLVSNSLLNTLLKYEPQFAREFANFISQGFYSELGNLVDDVKKFFNQKGFYLNYSEALQIVHGLNEFIHYTSTGESGEIVFSKNSFPQEEIGLIQDLLLAHGYSIDDHGGIDRGYFGNETENAVKDFQQQNGLSVDGVVGSQTLVAFLGLTQQKVKQPTQPKKEEKNPMPIKEEDWAINPDNKEEVGTIQDMLRSLNHFIDDKDGKYRGVYGGQTKSAVTQFQKIMGLPMTGRVDKLTLQTLTHVSTTYEVPEGFDVKTGPDEALIYNLSSQIKAVFPVIVETWKEFNLSTPVITSGNDGTHTSAASKHYINQAIDIRGNNVSDATLTKLAKTLQQKLGNDYDVDDEFFKNPSRDHIHIEYDPD